MYLFKILQLLPRFMCSAAGSSSDNGSVDVKMLAEQNVQLKEALKRLHSHSIAEKTDVGPLVHSSGRVCFLVLRNTAPNLRNVYYVYITVRVSGAAAFHAWYATLGFFQRSPFVLPRRNLLQVPCVQTR